jgi:hypothetical protein
MCSAREGGGTAGTAQSIDFCALGCLGDEEDGRGREKEVAGSKG